MADEGVVMSWSDARQILHGEMLRDKAFGKMADLIATADEAVSHITGAQNELAKVQAQIAEHAQRCDQLKRDRADAEARAEQAAQQASRAEADAKQRQQAAAEAIAAAEKDKATQLRRIAAEIAKRRADADADFSDRKATLDAQIGERQAKLAEVTAALESIARRAAGA